MASHRAAAADTDRTSSGRTSGRTSKFPATPLERLQELNHPSVSFYQNRARLLEDPDARPWERGSASADAYIPIFEKLKLDRPSQERLINLFEDTHEAQAEACRILAHLMRKRTSINNPSAYILKNIWGAEDWMNRPSFDSPDWDWWISQRTSGNGDQASSRTSRMSGKGKGSQQRPSQQPLDPPLPEPQRPVAPPTPTDR